MIRQQIMDALELRMKAIQGSDYQTDIGRDVRVWNVSAINASDLPVLNIKDTDEEIERHASDEAWKVTLSCEISVTCSGNTAIQDIRKMIADVYCAIGADGTLNGLAIKIIPEMDTIEREDEADAFVKAIIQIKIIYGQTAWRE